MNCIPIADVVLYSIITWTVLEKLLEIYISMRQIQVYRDTAEVPNELKHCMTEETMHKARLHGQSFEQYKIFKILLKDVIITCLELYFGVIVLLWDVSMSLVCRCGLDMENEIILSCMFTTLHSVVEFNKELPFELYRTFVLDGKHGLNDKTLTIFVWNQIKQLIAKQFMTPATAAIIFLVQRGGDDFFIWLWLFTSFVSLVLLTIYPIFIAPLFVKSVPLDDASPLRASMEEFAALLQFPLNNLYIVEGTGRSSSRGLYYYGLWYSKNIILYDTLLRNRDKPVAEADAEVLREQDVLDDDSEVGFSDDEILAVVAHELGHWKLNHNTKKIIIVQFYLLSMFAIFGSLFYYPPLYESVRFEPCRRPIIIGALIIFNYIMAPFDAIFDFGRNIFTHCVDYQADEFVRQLGFSEQLRRTLIKLNLDTVGFPVYDCLYSKWTFNQPTLLQRLKRLQENDETDEKKML